MDWTRLNELKAKAQTAEDFGEVWAFFHDHFGENQEFLRLGKPTTNKVLKKLLEAALREAGQHHLGSRVVISKLVFIDLPDRGFLHGPARVNDFMASLFYFTDVKVGMISLARLGSPMVHFSRFSLNVIGGDGSIDLQPDNASLN